MLFSENDDAKFVHKLTAELSLQIVQHGSTHFTPTSRTWLDVILVDDNDDIIDIGNFPAPFHNGHNIISASIAYNINSNLSNPTIYYRDFKNIPVTELNNFLSHCDWSAYDVAKVNVDTALSGLCTNLTTAIDKFALIKTFVQKKKAQPPWISAELSQLQRRRNALFKRYRRTKTHQH